MIHIVKYSTATDGPGPKILSNRGPVCKLCNNPNTLVIHFPPFQFISGDFRAVPWWEHDKYYCPACQFLFADWLGDRSMEEIGKEYAKANTDDQRRPTEDRMCRAPELLLQLLRMTGGTRFLDYGVGYNIPYIYELRGRGIDLWGCDISETVPYSRFIRKFPLEPLPENTFDGIYSTEVMEHLFHFREDFQRMNDLLEPGGMILHRTFSISDFWDGISPFPRFFGLWDPYHVSVFSDSSARILAEQIGLDYKGYIAIPGGGHGFLFRKPGKSSRKIRLSPWNPGTAWRCYRILQHELYIKKHYGQVPPTLEWLQSTFAVLTRVRNLLSSARKNRLVKSFKMIIKKLIHWS